MKTWSLVAAVAVAGLGSSVALAEPRRDAILADLREQARKEDPRFAGFSAERGGTLFRATHQGKDGPISCSTCHGASPLGSGQTRLGKAIDPMAVSKNPARYTDAANVEKWFKRNCAEVLGRACTAVEKGDFITFMSGQ
jgi:cytochrome c peroxidase